MSKRTKKLIINISVLLTLTGVTFLVLWFSYRGDNINFNKIWDMLKHSNSWCIVAAVACMLLFIIFEGLSLFVITRRLGHKTKLAGALAYSSSDTYYSAVTPSATGGQPASMFYMVRDGMSGGVAGFSLVFNLMAYTAAIIVMGVFAFAVRPEIFGLIGARSWGAQALIIFGFVIQGVVLGFFITCIMWSKAILKIGNGAIVLLRKIRIIKHEDKWREKWKAGVDKYSASRHIIREHPMLFIWALLLNLAQRVAQTLIPCFVCMAMAKHVDFLELFVMQTFVLLGYNMIPSPGGTGAYEFMYLSTYGITFDQEFILTAMIISRMISYYLCIIVSGLYTLIYHSIGLKRKKPEKEPELEKWQYMMYSEGEEWCTGGSTVMLYTEGEAERAPAADVKIEDLQAETEALVAPETDAQDTSDKQTDKEQSIAPEEEPEERVTEDNDIKNETPDVKGDNNEVRE